MGSYGRGDVGNIREYVNIKRRGLEEAAGYGRKKKKNKKKTKKNN